MVAVMDDNDLTTKKLLDNQLSSDVFVTQSSDSIEIVAVENILNEEEKEIEG